MLCDVYNCIESLHVPAASNIPSTSSSSSTDPVTPATSLVTSTTSVTSASLPCGSSATTATTHTCGNNTVIASSGNSVISSTGKWEDQQQAHTFATI